MQPKHEESFHQGFAFHIICPLSEHWTLILVSFSLWPLLYDFLEQYGKSECRGARALGPALLLPVVLKRNPWRSVRYVTDGESEKERARERTRLLRGLNSRHYELSTAAERRQCDVVPVCVFPASCLDVLTRSRFILSLDVLFWTM